MKKVLKSISGLLAGVALIVGISSCGKDKCETTNCVVGVCKAGTCECPAGYSGSVCQNIWVTKYIAVWDFWDGDPYNVTFKPSTDMSVMLMDNFWGQFNNVICELTSEKTFKFRENQVLESTWGNITIVSGEGSIDDLGIKITGKYTVKYESGTVEEIPFDASKM